MDWFKCFHCGKEKPIDLFYRDRSRPSGRRPRCKECEKLYIDRARRRQYEKDYRTNNPEKRSIIMARHYANNKKSHKRRQDAYRETDSFKNNHRKHAATRRAKMAEAFIEEVNYNEIYTNSGGRCFYCSAPVRFCEAEFDHFIPLALGGKHESNNIRCSCLLCNRSKGAKPPERVVGYQVV